MKKTLIAGSSLLALCLALPAGAEGTDAGSAGGQTSSGAQNPSSSSPAGGMSNSDATSPSTEGGAQARTGVVSRQDRKFVEDAAVGGMAEVQLGQLAAQRAQDQGVRDFGNAMVADHTPANQRLMTIAATLGITPPDKLDFMHRHKQKKLSKAEGKDFDEDYIEGEVKDHKKMAELLEDEMKDGQNADLKQYASDMLPRIKQHLEMAQRLKDQLEQKGKKD